MRKIERILLSALISITMFVLIGVNGHVQAQKNRAATATTPIAQRPLFSEYKGIRLGMPAEQVRTQLGTPTIKGDDQDYYVISATETAQFAYDAVHQVRAISVDYMGAGAPDYRSVVGANIEMRPDGSLYKMVRYEAQQFWVSYNRTSGSGTTMVTITIQKM